MRFKIFIVFFLGIFLKFVDATETRVGSLGGTGFFIHDETNIFYFPASINQYPGLMISELRLRNQMNSYSVGTHIPLGNGILGVYFNLPTNILIPDLGESINVKMNKKIMVFWGTQIGEKNLGFGLSFLRDVYEQGEGSNKISQSSLYLALLAGLSTKYSDLGVQFELPRISSERESFSTKWGGFGFKLNGRFFANISNNVQLIPVVHFSIIPTATDVSTNTKSETIENQQNLRVGFALGLKKQLTDKNFAVLATEVFSYDRYKTYSEDWEDRSTRIVFPGIYAGVESYLKKWLVIRMGAVQIFQKITDRSETDGNINESTNYNTGFKVSFGLGLSLSNFRLDLSLNENILFNGPYFISGTNDNYTSSNSMFKKVSLFFTF